jgi:hypothetical protein
VRVTEAVRVLRKAAMPPEVLRQLKLDKDWSRKVPESYVEQVVRIADQNKDVLKELADR